MKRNLIIITGVIAIILAVLFGLRLFSGEDSWICQNGEWIKHGNPSAPKPTESCGGNNQQTIKVKVYFNNDKLDPEFSCNKVFPIEREIPKTEAVARAAIEELLKGLTQEEKSEGYFTSINKDAGIQKLSIINGVAKIDFNENLEYQVGGSCRVSAIRAQITRTLKQFPTVEDVVISINGRTEDILQP